MNERQRDLRFLEWLFHTDGQASEAGDQPRTRNEQVGSTAGVVHPMVDTRYSLEDILRLESLAGGDNPGAIPLPESHSGYSMTGNGSDEDSSDEIGSSLNGLQQFDAEIDPTSVKLPSSAVESDRNEENPTPSLTYKEVIENAGRALPHIENGNVKADSRHKKASIIYYDYLHDGSTYSRRVKNASAIPSLADRLSVRQRLIVVEDLSKQTIDTLGTKFKINPEFFEEHLLNSGYSGADYNQPSSKTWNTASLQKSHICMKWFRPVWRTPTYFSHQDIHDLLADKTEHFTRRGTFTTRAATNIFRSEWGLWTDPEKTIRVNRECGWEEKVSIWSGKSSDSDCQIVIVLLDPLPQISEQERFFKRQSLHEAGNPDERTRLFPDIPDEERLQALGDMFGGSGHDLPRRMKERSCLVDLWKRYVAHQTMGKHFDHEPVFRCIIEQMAPRKNVQVDLDQLFHCQDLTMDFGTLLTQTKSTRDEFCEALSCDTGQINLVFPLLKILCRDTLALLKQLRHSLDEMDAEILNDERMEERLALWRQLISRAQKELPEFAASTRPFVAFMMKIDPGGVYEESLGNDPDETLNLQTLLEDIQSMTERLRVTSASLTSNMALLDSRRSIDEAHAVTRLTELAFIFIPLSFAASVFGMQIEPLASPVPIWWFFVVAVAATGCSYSMRIVMRSHWLTRMKIEMRADIRKYANKHDEHVQTGPFSVTLILRWGISSLISNTLKPGKWALRAAWIGSHWIYSQMGIAVSLLLLVSIIIAVPTGILRTHHLSPAIQTALSLGMILAAMFSLIAALTFSNSRPDMRTLWPRMFRREQMSDGPAPSRFSWQRPSTTSQHLPRRLKKFLLWSIPIITVFVIPMALLWTRSIAIDLKIGATIGVGVFAMCAPICILAYLIGQGWPQRDLPSRRRTSRIGTTT